MLIHSVKQISPSTHWTSWLQAASSVSMWSGDGARCKYEAFVFFFSCRQLTETFQAAFTIKEVRELMKLREVAFHPVDRSLIPEELKSLPRATRRLMEVLVKGTPDANPEKSAKSWSLDSCLSPKHFLGHEDSPTNVASTEFDVTQLLDPFDPQSRVEATEKTMILPSDVVFRSVGYKSVSLPGFREAGIQFDERRGIVNNDGFGRVTRLVSHDSVKDVSPQRVPGLYCAGWLKRGPTGVIASTMQDAFTTGEAIAQDWLSGEPFLGSSSQSTAVDGWDGVKQELGSRATRAVSWAQWRQIDAAEKSRGQLLGKEREKFTNTTDMLAVVG